ncbi:HAD-IA family hydrolase [Aureimonas jatrophae]|uniref:Phosphoglycolate phosphatase n=1 Tax=Aureimonas jatrophae TaxID=1166073 RepID=A0A1H0MTN2_9HYPH|nr:HAD-IA family hydrolase [Aureimonas jatrophae]MBB3951240.1 phosphoglycolate phosphatase [Aureimonas jatrophae]SDO83500.1 phosphoglycolate phosphatase [Aureimonas jatrophae]
MKAILFDCDGTLADSFGLICETMRRCFATAGLPVPERRAIEGIIGLSLDLAIHRLAPTVREDELPSLVAIYRQEFMAAKIEPAFREALFAGIEPMLRRLACRDDVVLGMVTGKSRRGVANVVAAHQLDGMFLAVRTADDCPSKPHPAMVLECCAELGIEPSQTVVVGDAIYDMQMAVSAGARAIGVAWGACEPATLVAAGADDVVPDPAALEVALGSFLESPSSMMQPVLD